MRIAPLSATSAVRACLAALLAIAFPAIALEPGEVLLIVNANVRQSATLAEMYRAARQIPADRICSLTIPAVDEIPFQVYERQVVPQVRQFLRERGLQDKVRCIVSFFGLPLRISDRQLSIQERQELDKLQSDLDIKLQSIRLLLERMERQARLADPAFKPQAGVDLPSLELRARAALGPLVDQANNTADSGLRDERLKAMAAYLNELGGPAEVQRVFGADPNPDPATQAKFREAQQKMQQANEQMQNLQELRYDADARERLRQTVAGALGQISLAHVLQAQLEYLKPDRSGASFDSELSMLWWDYYRRSSWQVNPLFYQVAGQAAGRPMIMTARLDASQSGIVQQMFQAGLKAERDGLKGKVVLDSRGIKSEGENAAPFSYGWYDQSIRSLAEIIKTKTRLPLLLDDSPDLLPPNSTTDVGLYCGWYSVRNYVPSCRFSPGAVGFHVGSFELVSLRAENEHGWCRGLTDDGISATLGPVAEPFLVAFPAADDFFPLLMTGRLTLAEVYWRTIPVTSWQMSLLGDPLYNPFKVNPALRVEDLPERLKIVFRSPATRPSPPSPRPASLPIF
jgi:uncharacterized protein (TIGR03790 family)